MVKQGIIQDIGGKASSGSVITRSHVLFEMYVQRKNQNNLKLQVVKAFNQGVARWRETR